MCNLKIQQILLALVHFPPLSCFLSTIILLQIITVADPGFGQGWAPENFDEKFPMAHRGIVWAKRAQNIGQDLGP